MTMVFMDSFDKYGTSAAFMLDGLYSAADFVALATTPAPPHGTYNLNLNIDGSSNVRFPLPDATQKKVGTGARYYFPSLPASNNAQTFLALFNDITNTMTVGIAIMTTGALQALNSDGSVIGATTGPVITANGWHHVECYVEISGSGAGVVNVYVDGAIKLNLSAKTMVNNSAIAQMKYGRIGGGGGAGFYMKDLYIYDTTSSYNNAAPVGDIQVLLLMPTANGTNTDWTASTGSAWDCINEVPPDDADYISHDATGLPKLSSFAFQELPAEATGVKSVQITGRQWKSDAGTATLQQSVISNAVTAAGTDRPISTAPTYYWDNFQTDPNTSAVWGVAAVNAAQCQVSRTS